MKKKIVIIYLPSCCSEFPFFLGTQRRYWSLTFLIHWKRAVPLSLEQSAKFLLLCFTEKKVIWVGMTWQRANVDQIFILGELSLLKNRLYVLLRFATYEKKLEWNVNKSSVKNRGLVTQHAPLCGLYALMCLAVYGFTRTASCRGAGSCALKCICDGFHMAEQNERAGLEETHIQNKCASHSPMDLGIFPSFGMCVWAWPCGWEVSCNPIHSAWP